MHTSRASVALAGLALIGATVVAPRAAAGTSADTLRFTGTITDFTFVPAHDGETGQTAGDRSCGSRS